MEKERRCIFIMLKDVAMFENPISAIRDLRHLRKKDPLVIDIRNTNRYCLAIKEKVGKTEYYFASPIYARLTGKLVKPHFSAMEKGFVMQGTNSTTGITEQRIVVENAHGRMILHLENTITPFELITGINGRMQLIPTMNGVQFVIRDKKVKIHLFVEMRDHHIRFNNTCFSVMKEKFEPAFLLSALYAKNKTQYTVPEITYQRLGENQYQIELSHGLNDGVFSFEINSYEPKLFQDTTVESKNIDKNNAFGAVGCIGQSSQFGEQWLYSRMDISKISNRLGDRIAHVFWHLPIIAGEPRGVGAFVLENRFCSFGSTWNKRKEPSSLQLPNRIAGKYLMIDMTALYVNHAERFSALSEGVVAKNTEHGKQGALLSTGDTVFSPQILEIQYK